MDRLTKERHESERLHPAAVRASESAGRAHAERPDPWRTDFERDRDRIVHCTAFRRLEHKTQVFITHVGDQYRTRLTHSLEVHQVARSMALALDLNEPLVEAVSLAHDLGHPPFGHTGEELLDRRMRGHGGFAHNRQALRVVELLERRSPEYRGLNLTAEVRQSLRKHEEVVDETSGRRMRHPLLEAQLVDLADSTAYHYHDLEDGVYASILEPELMERELELWGRAAEEVRRRHPNLEAEPRLFHRRVANELLGMSIVDIQEESLRRLRKHSPGSPREAQNLPERCIAHSRAFHSQVAELHRYLYENFYNLDEVKWNIRRATELLDRLFTWLVDHPQHVKPKYRETADSLERAVCDYLAGMTDRYVERLTKEVGILFA